jgi:hypothetical protein
VWQVFTRLLYRPLLTSCDTWDLAGVPYLYSHRVTLLACRTYTRIMWYAVRPCWRAVPVIDHVICCETLLTCCTCTRIMWYAVRPCWRAVPVLDHVICRETLLACSTCTRIVWHAVRNCWRAVPVLASCDMLWDLAGVPYLYWNRVTCCKTLLACRTCTRIMWYAVRPCWRAVPVLASCDMLWDLAGVPYLYSHLVTCSWDLAGVLYLCSHRVTCCETLLAFRTYTRIVWHAVRPCWPDLFPFRVRSLSDADLRTCLWQPTNRSEILCS